MFYSRKQVNANQKVSLDSYLNKKYLNGNQFVE